MAVVCAAAGLPSPWCDPRLAHPGAVLTTTAIMSCYCLVAMVCGAVRVSISLWSLCGGVSSVCLPPCRGGGWGYRWVVGGMMRWGGMVSEGRVLLC